MFCKLMILSAVLALAASAPAPHAPLELYHAPTLIAAPAATSYSYQSQVVNHPAPLIKAYHPAPVVVAAAPHPPLVKAYSVHPAPAYISSYHAAPLIYKTPYYAPHWY